jgi:hypothetical protein
MNFNKDLFYKFCSELKIETKEQGLRKMNNLLGTQTYVMDEIAKGLEDDIHFFVILKGRQLGITTISLALDLYWHFTHPGLQGTLTTDTEENRDMFRSTLAMYMEGLPKNIVSLSWLIIEISFPSKTEVDCFIKWLDYEQRDLSVVVKQLHTSMEQKHPLGR